MEERGIREAPEIGITNGRSRRLGARGKEQVSRAAKSIHSTRVFEFDTTKSGNSNSGEYGTKLSEEEKMQLLEFLKSFKQTPLPKE